MKHVFWVVPAENFQEQRKIWKGTVVRFFLACEYSRFSLPLAAKDVSPGGTSATQRQKFHTDVVKSVLNLVRLVDVVVILFYLLFELNDTQKTSGHNVKNVSVMNQLQNSQYSYNIFFFRKPIWVLLELFRKR